MATTTTEQPSKTLADVITYASSRFINIRAKQALNLGAMTMLTSLDIGTFLHQSTVGNDPLKGAVTQRAPDVSHARRMASFIFKGLINYTISQRKNAGLSIPGEAQRIAEYLGNQPYYAWSPIVGSIRDSLCEISVKEVDQKAGEWILQLRSNQLIWVVDGQHRRMAWEIIFNFLKQLANERKYVRANKLVPADLKVVGDDAVSFWHEALTCFSERFSVSIELHFGLTTDQEQQLFHDLNNLTKNVSASLAQNFDKSNQINIFTNNLLESSLFENAKIIEDGEVEWDSDTWMKLHHLNAINARLFLNRATIASALPAEIHAREEQAWQFWGAVTKIPGIFDRKASIAAQPVVLKSIARVFFDILWSRKAEGETISEQFLNTLPKIDFSHSNPIWKIRDMPEELLLKNYPDFLKYVPENWRENFTIDFIDEKIRFGHRHNDLILVLPGIIRYLAKLLPRT